MKYRFNTMLAGYWALLFMVFTGATSFAQETISVDFGKKIKTGVKRGAGSANLCWLTDSDKKRPNTVQSMESAIKELGCGSLRFPYGHLADNYLWHTPPYDDTENGLRPKVAAHSKAPYGWEWAVNEDGSFTSAMDFDEYMQICQRLNIKPLVVVNVFSFKYEGGPTYEELKIAAVEWVKYAKKKNYHVEYWQIGNEVDHHKKLLKMNEYVDLYQDVASAMKVVDPSVKIGPGILKDTTYYNTILAEYPGLIDFTSCHQYAWKYTKSCSSYEKWKEHVDKYIHNVLDMQEAVCNSSKPNLDIVVTETGVTPVGRGMGDVNNTHKALWYFEMLMNEISQPNVAYTYFWGTHSPWSGLIDSERDLGLLLRLDDNSRKPIADVVKLVNDNMLDNLVQAKQFSGYVRTFAGKSNDGEKYNVFLMNRNDKPQKVNLQANQLPARVKQLKRKVFSGDSPESKNVNIKFEQSIAVEQANVELILPPLSVTILYN